MIKISFNQEILRKQLAIEEFAAALLRYELLTAKAITHKKLESTFKRAEECQDIFSSDKIKENAKSLNAAADFTYNEIVNEWRNNRESY